MIQLGESPALPFEVIGSLIDSGSIRLGSSPGGGARSVATVIDESGGMSYYGDNAHEGLISRLKTKLMV